MKEFVFHSHQTTLNYFEGPQNGLPILLLHGSTSRWQSFSSLITDLQQNYHVYALDLRGHGKSGRTPGAYKLQDHLQDICLFIEKHIQKPVYIFGNSLGGMIAIMLAAQHPNLVRALMIGDAPITLNAIRRFVNNQSFIAQTVIQLLRVQQADQILQLFPKHFAENLSQCDPDMLSAIFNEFDVTFEKYQIDNLLPHLHCPTLILRGNVALGSLITDEDMEYALNLLPSLQQVSIASVGHSLLEDKNSVLNIIEGFIEEVSAQTKVD